VDVSDVLGYLTIETPEVYVNAEEVEVADKIGSSVELNGSRTKRTGGVEK
jgi:hypothetical protein